ncbi:MAG: circadian clock protein KaiC [Belnapia sp.]|nr:circadian clock protein KaiC [Belnapia sp.]
MAERQQGMHEEDPPRISTGSEGLDDILGGGLDADRLYLCEGRPGAGKTTLALQFLRAGVALGETTLYVSLSETERELRLVARRHGWSLDGIEVFELVPPEASLDPSRELTVFHPAEMELNETTRLIFDRVVALNPTRIVLDSLSELRLLAQNSLRYRRQILALKHFFTGRTCTVLMLDDMSSRADDLQLHSIAHGVIMLENVAVEYGSERRRLRVVKMRGIPFRGGFHDFAIRHGGLAIYPRLIAAEHRTPFAAEIVSSGMPGMDAMLGGGLARGSSLLLMGAAGVGKSSLSLGMSLASAGRGEHAVIYAFDEGRAHILARSAALGMVLDQAMDTALVRIQQVDPAELSPGEFIHLVRQAVEVEGARLIVIDSLNGYLSAMPDERFLILQMHELLSYLNQRGVLTVLVLAQHGMIGPLQTPVDISYLSDAVMLLRYFEFEGEVRRALSVVKKRSGRHERSIREFQLDNQGVAIGPPLRHFTGVFTGTPLYTGTRATLLGTDDGDDAAEA